MIPMTIRFRQTVLLFTLAVLFSTFFANTSWALRAPETNPAPEVALDAPPTAPPAIDARQRSADVPAAGAIGAQSLSTGANNPFIVHFKQHPELLGLSSTPDLRVDYIRTVPGAAGVQARTYVNLIQTVNGIDVDGTQISFSFDTAAGPTKLQNVQSRLQPDARRLAGTTLATSATARQRIASRAKATRLRELSPRIRFMKGQWRALREFVVEDRGLRGAVDANGETYVWDGRYYSYDGSVSGRGVAFDPVTTGSALPQLPLSDLTVTPGNYTDPTGQFSLASAPSSTVSVGLQGRWAQVQDQRGANLTQTLTPSTPSPANLLFNNTGNNEYNVAQVNGYYHTTRIHNYLTDRGIAPAYIQSAIPVRVNLSDVCNAFYDYSSINFFSSGSGCINTAFDTIIYHEYGHFVDDAIGGITDGGLSEGWGDLLAAYLSGQPSLAEGFYGTPGSALRSALNTYQYNPNHEIHLQGTAWAGFAWDLRVSLIASLGPVQGVAVAENLVVPVLWANSPNIPAAMREVALRDSSTGEIGKNSPHFSQIQTAAMNHGIYISNDTVPPTISITNPSSGATVTGVVSVTGTAADNEAIKKVSIEVDGTIQGDASGTTSWSYVLDTSFLSNGPHTITARVVDANDNMASAYVTVMVANIDGTAAYSTTYKAPLCSNPIAVCDSGLLIRGRGTITNGNEPNQPNTIANSCADGSAGSFHSDESIDKLRIVSANGLPLSAGSVVNVTATVWAFSGNDHLDVFYAGDAASPTWTLIGSFVPTKVGLTSFTTTFTLPPGAYDTQAIRASFRYGTAAPMVCGTGIFDESDDLVFRVVNVADNTPPTGQILSPSNGQFLSGIVTISGTAADNVGLKPIKIRVDETDLGFAVGTTTWSYVLDTSLISNGTHYLSAVITDFSGNSWTPYIQVTIANTEVGVVYDPVLKAPRCKTAISECDSGDLLKGRGLLANGSEIHQPNTLLNSCNDGSSGNYRSDESNESIKVQTLDGMPFAAGKIVKVEATVWAYQSYSSDFLDLYHATASSTTAPSWVHIATLKPTQGGINVLSSTYTLPTGNLQAVRARFRFTGSISPCAVGGYDDHDDLVFDVQSPPAGKPDLVISQFSVSPAVVAPNGSFQIQVTVLNQGTGAANSNINLQVTEDILPSASWGANQASLAPGEAWHHTFYGTATNQSRLHAYHAVVVTLDTETVTTNNDRFAFMTVADSTAAVVETPLSDLPWKSFSQPLRITRDFTPQGTYFKLNGTTYTKGFSFGAPTYALFPLPSGMQCAFYSAIGLDDISLSSGPALFSSYVDFALRYMSPLLQKGAVYFPGIDLTNASTLQLIVDGNGDGDWANASLRCSTPGLSDTTPPAIGNVQALVLSSSAVQISWSTDEPSKGTIEFGPTTQYGYAVSDDRFVRFHEVIVSSAIYNPGLYHFRVQSSDVFNNKATSNDFTFDTSPQVPDPSTATFIKMDATTQGTWKGNYGAQGYSINGDVTLLPSYAQLSVNNSLSHTWEGSTTDVRGLQKANSDDRIASAWYSESVFQIDLNLTDGATHQVALYALDWDIMRGGRTQVIQVRNAAGSLLDSRSMTSFQGGQYAVWTVKGHVVFYIYATKTLANAVINGVFLGVGVPPSPPPPPASTAFVTSKTLGVLRNDYTGWVGATIKVGANPLTLTSLGRIVVAGNNMAHTMKVVDASSSQDVPGSLVMVYPSTGVPGTFVYGNLSATVTLAANKTYYVITEETNGKDRWHDINTTVQTTNVASVLSGVYKSGSSYITQSGASNSYGPVDFKYLTSSTPPPPPPPPPAPPTGDTPFVTGQTLGSVRNDYSGWVGMQVRTGANPVTITALGRIVVAGNAAAHSVKLVDGTSWQDVPGASALVNPSAGIPGNYVYTSLGTPIVLPANKLYYVVTQETNQGDKWYNNNTQLQATSSVATIPGFVYSTGPSSYVAGDSVNAAFGPVNFQYSSGTTPVPPPPPPPPPPTSGISFVTNQALGTVRNNHNGWVGMKLQVGPAPMIVTAIGRMRVTGNSASHTVKIVDAATSQNVPGTVVTVNLATGTLGSYVYGNLSAPVTLAANKLYYVITQETSGGDSWHDLNTLLTTTLAGTVTGPIYSNASAPSNYIPGSAGTNHSYGPVNLLYTSSALGSFVNLDHGDEPSFEGSTTQNPLSVNLPSSTVNVYPNPFRAKRGDQTITFDTASEGSTVKIFTVSGRWVRTLTTDSLGKAPWDLKNDSGDNVASGIYVYLMTNPSGDKVHGKFTIIR